VLELAARGANVVVNTRSNEAEAETVAKEAESLGARSLVVMGDAAEKATVERMRTEAENAFGGVDIYRDHEADFATRRRSSRRDGSPEVTTDQCWRLVFGSRDRD